MDLLFLIFLLILSALFSGTETAFFSLRKPQLAQLANTGGNRGRAVVALLEKSHSLLSALLVGNLLVNTAASVLVTSLCLAWFGRGGLVVAVPAATLALLLFGEITPKMLALRYGPSVALVAERPLALWLWICRPLLAVIGAGTERLVRLLPYDRTGTRPLKTAELEAACDLAVQEGALSETEGRFLARLLLLQDLEVRQIMTPRPDVVALDATASWQDVCNQARQAGFDRFPVMAPDRSQPIGMIQARNLFGPVTASSPLVDRLDPLPFAPESKDVAALLAEMRAGGDRLAAVVDEHGDFSGIVTLTDCLEALIGQLGRGSSLANPEVLRLDGRTWVLAGGLDLRELNEACGVALPPSRDYVTVAGFLMERLGRIPRVADQVDHAGFRFTVLEMVDHKVLQIQVVRLTNEEKESAR